MNALNDVVGVVLAAGMGTRMGGPKALLRWPRADGAPLALAHAAALHAASLRDVVLVVRASVADVLRALLPPSVLCVVSDAPEDWGPAGSIAAAVAQLGVTRGLLVTPVDTLPVSASVVSPLLKAAGASPCDAARPVFQGRRGHPVLLLPSSLDAYTRPPPPILRAHLRALHCVDVPVDDPRIVNDLNTVEDVVAATGAPPQFV